MKVFAQILGIGDHGSSTSVLVFFDDQVRCASRHDGRSDTLTEGTD
jgi:hypothetical protein